jgi:glycosyltransferase involved in cell wall biosynthesis
MSEHFEEVTATPVAVTVIVPLHNHVDFIDECLDSLVAQDYPIQIVVVDDGSTDGSLDRVLRRLSGIVYPEQQDEPWVCKGLIGSGTPLPLMACRFKEARGPSFARNWGIRVAWEATDVFGFLDSDDTYAPNKVSRSLDIIQRDPEVIGAVYSDFDTFRSRTARPGVSRQLRFARNEGSPRRERRF